MSGRDEFDKYANSDFYQKVVAPTARFFSNLVFGIVGAIAGLFKKL